MTDRQSRAEQLRAHIDRVSGSPLPDSQALAALYLADCEAWAQLLQEAESSFTHMEELYMGECQKNNDLRSRAASVTLERNRKEEELEAELETLRGAAEYARKKIEWYADHPIVDAAQRLEVALGKVRGEEKGATG